MFLLFRLLLSFPLTRSQLTRSQLTGSQLTGSQLTGSQLMKSRLIAVRRGKGERDTDNPMAEVDLITEAADNTG